MKIKLIATISLLITLLIPSVYGFGRIRNAGDALSKELNVIHLIGEYHDLKQDINQKNLLKKIANNGKIILGLEGLLEEEGREFHATIFGIEESSSNDLSFSFLNLVSLCIHAWYKSSANHGYAHQYKFSTPDLQTILNKIGNYLILIFQNQDPDEILFFQTQISQNRVLINLWQAIQEDLEGTFNGHGSIYRHIGKNSINDNFFDNLSNNNHEWLILLKQVVQYFITLNSLEEETKNLHEVLSELNNLYEETEVCSDHLKLKQIIDRLLTIRNVEGTRLLVFLRNKVFLNNIRRAFNEKKHLDKPFFVIVGAEHVAFLKRNLINQGFVVAVNENLYDYSSDELAEKLEL